MTVRIALRICLVLFISLACTEENGPVNDPTPRQAPLRIDPADGSTVSHPVLFYWSSETAYDTYAIRVAANQQLTRDVITLTNYGASDEILRDTLEAGQYYWKVGGIVGGDTVWSDVGNFFYEPPFDARQYAYCCIELRGIGFEVETVSESWERGEITDSSVTTSVSTKYLGWFENCCTDEGSEYRVFIGRYQHDIDPGKAAAQLWVYFNRSGGSIDSLRYEFEYTRSSFGNSSESHVIRFVMVGAGSLAPTSEDVYRVSGTTQLETFFHTLTQFEDYSYNSAPLMSGSRYTSVTQGLVYSDPAYIELQFHR